MLILIRKEEIQCMNKFKTPNDIWNNKNIKPEAKEIYSYLYCRGFDRTVFHFNIGDIQNYIPITNVGFRNNLKI